MSEWIKVGDKVINKDGDIGIVVNMENLHDVEVEYLGGGVGLYCIDKECPDYEGLELYNPPKEGD